MKVNLNQIEKEYRVDSDRFETHQRLVKKGYNQRSSSIYVDSYNIHMIVLKADNKFLVKNLMNGENEIVSDIHLIP
jgi:hypothetical protein